MTRGRSASRQTPGPHPRKMFSSVALPVTISSITALLHALTSITTGAGAPRGSCHPAVTPRSSTCAPAPATCQPAHMTAGGSTLIIGSDFLPIRCWCGPSPRTNATQHSEHPLPEGRRRKAVHPFPDNHYSNHHVGVWTRNVTGNPEHRHRGNDEGDPARRQGGDPRRFAQAARWLFAKVHRFCYFLVLYRCSWDK